MSYSFSDIVLIPFPFTNQTATKKRPAVIISSNPYNQNHIDVILMAITSQQGAAAYADNLIIQDWQAAGLLRPSLIKPIITTVEKRLILKKLGCLSAVDQQTLTELLAEILG